VHGPAPKKTPVSATDAQKRLALRRAAEKTEEWKDRYRLRAGEVTTRSADPVAQTPRCLKDPKSRLLPFVGGVLYVKKMYRIPVPPLFTIQTMNWKETASALGLPLKACFDLTDSERRFLLGLLLLFCLGLGARWLQQRSAQPTPYSPSQELAQP